MDSEILNTIRTRPRFVYESQLSKDDYLNLLDTYFKKKNKKIGGYITQQLSYFRIRQAKDSIWSPCLQLKVEEDPYDGVTYVRGLFGPKPSIWTLFSFIYFGSMALGSLSFLLYATSLSFKPMPFLLYIGFFFTFVVIIAFMTSKIGQSKTKNQMRLLKTFILMVIKDEYQKTQHKSAKKDISISIP